MSYSAEVFNVMIASPGDVKAERAQVREVIHEWNAVHSRTRKIVLLPTGWETHSAPEMGSSPQTIINRQVLEKCDLLVGIFWTRVGTATDEYASGTVEEIEKHVFSGRPVMLYFSSQPAALDTVDHGQYKLLTDFKNTCKERSLYEGYDDLSDFRNKFSRQLQITLNDPKFNSLGADKLENVVAEVQDIPKLSYEAKMLLKEASLDAHGSILYIRYIGGTDIQTNGKNIIDSNERRSIAKWESALVELERLQFVVARGSKGEVYEVTASGFTFADTLDEI